MKTKISLDTEKLNQSDLDYYRNQFNKLKDLTQVSIKLTDFEGNQTFNLNLNAESLFEIIQLFKKKEGLL